MSEGIFHVSQIIESVKHEREYPTNILIASSICRDVMIGLIFYSPIRLKITYCSGASTLPKGVKIGIKENSLMCRPLFINMQYKKTNQYAHFSVRIKFLPILSKEHLSLSLSRLLNKHRYLIPISTILMHQYRQQRNGHLQRVLLRSPTTEGGYPLSPYL